MPSIMIVGDASFDISPMADVATGIITCSSARVIPFGLSRCVTANET
jgi:hypothetical protein